MAFTANEFGPEADPLVIEGAGPSLVPWTPMFWHGCSFGPEVFMDIMLNLIKNPNINSSWLFRADILFDGEGDALLDEEGSQHTGSQPSQSGGVPQIPVFGGFECERRLIRKLIPRNTARDDPLDQTCLVYKSASVDDDSKTLVVYLPHVASEADVPFYHPKVRGLTFLHSWDAADSHGTISISYLYFAGSATNTKLTRTALNLLSVISKHGEGRVSGYVKRVHHDLLVPQAPFQNRYALLKQKYARPLIEGWAESTDPQKHVFEDLGIAAFLIELWDGMYSGSPFPGFVDIGCGNGLLVYILNQEGYLGWGFDARSRKSWKSYNSQVCISAQPQESLRQLVLVPSIIRTGAGAVQDAPETGADNVHDGIFSRGTFIISNHADELTPWTPILAAASQCPFVMIPCCSHNLTGAKFRAPPPKDKSKSDSTYSSLVSWVSDLASDCGWRVEKEMLRIPSTRNTALVGRNRIDETCSVDIPHIMYKHGGTDGYLANAMRLAKTAPRGH